MFLNMETGEMVFADGFRLFGNMSADELNADAEIYFAGAKSVDGVPLSVECQLKGGALSTVTLRPLVGSAARRRASLFSVLGIDDPCPDTRACVRVSARFGRLSVISEPYFGRAEARVEYRESAVGQDI